MRLTKVSGSVCTQGRRSNPFSKLNTLMAGGAFKTEGTQLGEAMYKMRVLDPLAGGVDPAPTPTPAPTASPAP